MEEIHKLRSQICNIVSATFPSVETGLAQTLKPPNETQVGYFTCYRLVRTKQRLTVEGSSPVIGRCIHRSSSGSERSRAKEIGHWDPVLDC